MGKNKMRNRRNKKNEDASSQNWLTTYGDLITLLLTFFVFLFSFSTIDAQKFKAIVASLQGYPGVLESGFSIDDISSIGKEGEDDILDNASIDENNGFVSLYDDIRGYIKQNNINAEVIISESQTEILIRFIDSILFDSGKADIKQEAYPILNKIAQVFKVYEDHIKGIRIEGHTDNRPINTKEFPSNWELSTTRAVRVLRYFIEEKDISSDILSAVGYGEYQPIAPNDTAYSRALNRRVDFVIAKLPNMNSN